MFKFAQKLTRCLNGKLFKRGHQKAIVYPKLVKELKVNDSVFLRSPDFLPNKVIEDLSILFEKHQSILSAYLAEGFLEAGESLHYIVGIKIDPKAGLEIEQLMELMAKDFNEVIPRGFYLDVIGLKDKKKDATESAGRKNDINDFMENYLIPFYSKKV